MPLAGYSTIESHLAFYILDGKLNVADIVPGHKLPLITVAIEKHGQYPLSLLKEALGEDVSYGEIRAVINHLSTGKGRYPFQTNA